MSRTKFNSADGLVEYLDLEKLEEDLFRGQSPQVGWQRVFGGHVIGHGDMVTLYERQPMNELPR